jgi:hypothetical protein
MFNHPYVIEKLIELERRPMTRFSPRDLPPTRRRANGIARSLGRAMRTAGERLESWAGPNGGSQARAEYFPEARRY